MIRTLNDAKEVAVGTYSLGYENVQLVLRAGLGGEFYFEPEDKCARIKIGVECSRQKDLLNVLMHEACEMALSRVRTRYSHSEDLARDVHSYLFVVTHPQFSEAIAMTAEFVDGCWREVLKAWHDWRRAAHKEAEADKKTPGDSGAA